MLAVYEEMQAYHPRDVDRGLYRQENRVLIVTTCGDSGIAAGMGGTGSRV